MSPTTIPEDAKGPSLTAPYPWRRFFAFEMDYFIASLICMLVLYTVRWQQGAALDDGSPILRCLTIAFFEGLGEAFLLSTVGTTPGKWAFGLCVRQMNGERLIFQQAALRALKRSVYGNACGVPILSLWRLWVSFRTCAKGEVLPWDMEVSYSRRLDSILWEAEVKETLRWVCCILAAALCGVGLILGIMLTTASSLIPVHRGPLTKVEFIENCEDFARRKLDWKGCYLDEDLIWRTSPTDGQINAAGGHSIPGAEAQGPYELTFNEEGHITAVRLVYEFDGVPFILYRHSKDAMILRNAFVMANNRINLWQMFQILLQYDDWNREIWQNDFEHKEGCVWVTHEIEYSGYVCDRESSLLHPDGLLYPAKGREKQKKLHYRWVLTMELINVP